MTTTPCAVADLMSTLSTPMPARPTTFSFLASAKTSAVTLVAERMAEALVVADDGAQLGGLQAGPEIDVAATLGEDFHRAAGKAHRR